MTEGTTEDVIAGRASWSLHRGDSLAWCRASRSGAVVCLFTDWRMLPATTDALQAGGWMWRGARVVGQSMRTSAAWALQGAV